MTPKDAQRRLEIPRFFDKHGLAATRDAFAVSRRTPYRWQATLKAQGSNPAALAAKSSTPKKRRTPNTDPRLVSEIQQLRTLHPNLGKAKLRVLLEPWCAQHGIALPSVSTIGRIICRAPDKMRHTPCRIDSRGRVKPPRRHAKTGTAGRPQIHSAPSFSHVMPPGVGLSPRHRNEPYPASATLATDAAASGYTSRTEKRWKQKTRDEPCRSKAAHGAQPRPTGR